MPVPVLVAFSLTSSRPSYLTDTWADTDIHWEGDSWNDTGTNLYGCLKQFGLLKRRNRNLKVLLSIGGWTYSSNFARPASTAHGRSTFARTAVDLVRNLGFDGLDIDWEHPKTPAEAADLVALLQTCRGALDQYARESAPGRHFELTIASSAGPHNYDKMDLRAVDGCLDFWNIMAYDFAGSWDSNAGHQANLFPCSGHGASCTPFSAVRAVSDYVQRGVPPHKIVLGMPLYGRAFQNTDGPGKPYSGVGEGSWENGVHDYKDLPLKGSEIHIEEEAHASYCYDPAKRVMVTYDTCDMARRKAKFICHRGMGGAMWWESSADKKGPESIIVNVANVFREAEGLKWEENCIEYPASRYENLRNGFPSK